MLEKTIEQGDLFSHVFGKERNGYVRCIGMGKIVRLGTWLLTRIGLVQYICDEGENSETGYMAAEKEDDHVMSNRPMVESQAKITQQKKQVLVFI